MSFIDEKESANSAWSIREFSDLFDITPRAVRFYEDKGLISPNRESGTRVFGAADHTRMISILRAKRLGFTLDDIKVVLDVTDGRITDREELAQRSSNFKKVIKSLSRRKTDIDILTRDMNELCRIMDDKLENTEANTEVVQLANAYDAAFKDYFASDNQFIGN